MQRAQGLPEEGHDGRCAPEVSIHRPQALPECSPAGLLAGLPAGSPAGPGRPTLWTWQAYRQARPPPKPPPNFLPVPVHPVHPQLTSPRAHRVLHESVSLLESLNATTADPTIQGFKWFLEAHSAFQCTFLVLSELQELRFTSPEDSAIRARAIAALKQLVVLHHGDGGGPQSSSSSRPWAVIKKYVERLERPAAGEQGGEVSGGGGVDGAGAGAGPMEGVRSTTAADVSADDAAAAAAAAAGGFEAAANGMMGAAGFDDDSPSSMMVLPQPFATEEELLQFTFPPGTEWTDPMQDFSLWHVQ